MKPERQPDNPGYSRPKAEGVHYTQVNILFPSEQVELPSAEKFKAFPPEAQQAILAAFEREQIERHAWLKNQQANEHELNLNSERHYFEWRMVGTIAGWSIVTLIFATGAFLVIKGASTIGVAAMLGAVAGLIGTAIFGHRASSSRQAKNRELEEENPASD